MKTKRTWAGCILRLLYLGRGLLGAPHANGIQWELGLTLVTSANERSPAALAAPGCGGLHQSSSAWPCRWGMVARGSSDVPRAVPYQGS